MTLTFLEALEGAEHEQVQLLQDPEIDMVAILAIHDTSHGPAFGGIRRYPYRTGAEALRDVLRLSKAMTYKCLMTGIAGGGGKGVLVDRPGLDLAEAYRRIGRFVQNMGGRFYTGPDIGTSDRELAWLSESTRFVTLPGEEGPGDLSTATARGVLAGIRAVLRFLARKDPRLPGDPAASSYEGLRFAVQGLGDVGSKVVRELCAKGAEVCVSEVREEALSPIREELEVEVEDPGRILDRECDVFVPCALGGILHDLASERLRCRAIAGSANNILAKPEHGRLLHDHGILIAPDYVINSGALILGANFHLTGDRDQEEAIDHIEDILFEIFMRSESEGVSTCELADRMAEERLSKNRGAMFFPDADRDR